MIVIVAPEPVGWLSPLIHSLKAEGPLHVIAPWRLGVNALTPLQHPFLKRRRLALRGAEIQSLPGFSAGEALARLWAKNRTERRLALRFLQRAAVDRIAAQQLPPTTQLVIAPSCSAQRTFARARARDIRCVLLEDLPSLRRLHADLDKAAKQHPDCRFLRHFRASPRAVARQEAERLLAHEILVRGTYTAAHLRELGFPATLWEPTPPPPIERNDAQSTRRPARCVVLAGLGTGRNGLIEAVDAIEHIPGSELRVREGEGLEPNWIRSHPQVRLFPGPPPLEAADLVIAPAWSESYPAVLRAAVARGIPIAATPQAAGSLQLAPRATLVPGDNDALVGLLRHPPAGSHFLSWKPWTGRSTTESTPALAVTPQQATASCGRVDPSAERGSQCPSC